MDLNVRAFKTVQAAFAETTEPDKRKEASRKGGLNGGRSRARSMSAKRRKEIAELASRSRWNSKPKTGSE